MNLNLTVLTSTAIKRKKPWSKVSWLGKDQGGLYLLDKTRVSQLYLPSGKTRRKIPSVHPFLVDVATLSTSSNGKYLAGALKSGKVFVWMQDNDDLHTTPVLDKVRNVLGTGNRKVSLFISNCGKKIILLSGFDQIFLWETENDLKTLSSGEPFAGRWVQVQSGDYTLPSDQDKETAIDGVFYQHQVYGSCALVSWVFNKEEKIHITTLRLQWPSVVAAVLNSEYDDTSLPFTAKWFTFVHPLFGLIPAKRVIKSSKAYIGRFSHDGQALAIAMNQKNAADSRMMFYMTTSSSVAIVTDLKGCGASRSPNVPASGRLWWISDMAWTRDDLLLLVITRCGSLAVLTKLGEPVMISALENSTDMGPNLYLPLHPRITFIKQTNDENSSLSETDVLQQRFSVATHPNLPLVLTTDGYLVTVMQLPGNASYKGTLATLMSSISNLVPEVQLDPSMVSLTLSSATCKLNLFQSQTNMIQSTEDLSENTMSSCSSSLAGYGLASGDQGMAYMPVMSSESYQPPDSQQDRSWKLQETQTISLKALALGVSTGLYWSKDMSTALAFVVQGIVKLFSVCLRDQELLHRSTSSVQILSRHRVLWKSLQNPNLEDCFNYMKMALELFQWDSNYRNAFSLALRMVNGLIKEILSSKQLDDIPKIENSIHFLGFAEELLCSVYSWKKGSKANTKGQVIDRFSPDKSIPKGTKFSTLDPSTKTINDQERSQAHAEDEERSSSTISQTSTLTETTVNQEPSQVAKDLSGSWLLLYNYTAGVCKRWNQQMTSDNTGISNRLTQLLCDIQKKLQDIGVAIPTEGPPKMDHMSDAASLIESKPHNKLTLPGISAMDSLSDSLFGRRRANYADQDPNQSTPIKLRKTLSLDHLLDVSAIKLQHSIATTETKESTTDTLLAILYLNLQEYNLKSALELVFSLMEPSLDHVDTTFSALFAAIDSLRVSRGAQDQTTNQLLSVLMQTYPIIRVADKCGVAVVQSLGRFMAAYFSNHPLYVFPAYHPNVLPPFYLGEPTACESTSDESFALSQGVEVVHLEREKVASAVRDQGISDIWCVNNAVELMLLSGLVSEASWISNNLGDWKHALLLSVSHNIIVKTSQHKNIPATLLPNLPNHITPENIILTRLHPVLHSSPSSLPHLPKHVLDIAEDATSTPIRDRLIADKPNDGKLQLEVDDKIVKDVGMVLQASVVAGLDVVPLLSWEMLQDLLLLVSQLEWIVPEELYLPAPPLFCPQPPNVEKEFLLPRVYRERQLRLDIASSIQNLLTLFHSSNCMTPCTQWYVDQLVTANEQWYNLPKDDQDFIVPQSLLAHGSMATSFAAADLSLVRALKRNSTKTKDKPSPPRPSKTPGSSVSIVLACFQQFCFITWLLHARDKMSLCARKYRHARNAAPTDPEIAEQIEGLCWETLRWTLQLQPFGSFLGASAQVSDSLLTLLSEMPPSIATAQITAQYFPDHNLIPTTSGRAKFKRLMSQFRGITLHEAGILEEENSDEPLSVFYREKCLEYDDELKDREQLFGRVQIEVFQRENSNEELASGNSQSAVSFGTHKDLPCVGAMLFETSEVYLAFLDTFFIITFTKTAVEMTGQATTGIPFLLPYAKLFTFAESKKLKELYIKATVDKHKKPPIEAPLQRSQSYTDVRSSKPIGKQSSTRNNSLRCGQTDIKRSNSMSDVNKVASNSGFAVLGEDLSEELPRLAWLNRWSSESSYLPTSTMKKAAIEGQSVMKVDVDLPMLVNSLWLFYNVYIPWELNENVKPEFLKALPKPLKPISEQECLIENESMSSVNNLRRACSDSNIPKVTVQSPTTEEESLARKQETNKQTEKEDQVPTSKSHPNKDLIQPARSKQSKASPQLTQRRSRTARRTLLLDTEGDPQTFSNKDEEIHVKKETPRKKKTSRGRPSCSKVIPGDNMGKAAPNPNQDEEPYKTNFVPVAHEEISPVLTTHKMAKPPLDFTDKPTANDKIGTQSRDRTRRRSRVAGNPPQSITDGMELVLLLRSNSSNQSNGNATTDDVPVLKLSTMASSSQVPCEPKAKSKSKENASQTDASPSFNVPSNGEDSRGLLANQQVISTAVDFGAQYDECRDASCQTTLSPALHHDAVPSERDLPGHYNGVPSGINHPIHNNGVAFGNNHPMQYNDLPSRTNHPMQYNSLPSRINHTTQSNFAPSGTSLPTHYNGVPFKTNYSTHYNGVPSEKIYAFQNTGIPSAANHPSNYNGIPNGPFHDLNLSEQQRRVAWPEQTNSTSVPPYPLLRFSRNPFYENTATNQLIPPFRGFTTQNESSTDKEQSFPLLRVPKQTPTQPTKSFRLFEVPPAPRDLPLLHIPQVQDDKQQRPDLSKIKFVDVKTVREPCKVFGMKSSKPTQQQLLHIPLNDSKSSLFKSIPIEQEQTPLLLLQMPKEKPKLKLVPAEELEAFEKTKRMQRDYSRNEKENVKPKKVRERKRRHQHQENIPQDVRNTVSRQRRREKVSSHQSRTVVASPKLVQVEPASRKEKKKVDKTVQQIPKPSIQLENGLSEESELELSKLSENMDLSDEEQLYFNVQTKSTVSNAQVDEYCRELEEKVKKQFHEELEALKKKQMELEVKERVRKEIEKKREEDEVRKRLEEERLIQERLERERFARKEKIQKEEQQQTSPRPTPRKRSVKWEKGAFVFQDDLHKKQQVSSQNNVEVVKDRDLVSTSVDQTTQTISPSTTDLKLETKPGELASCIIPEDKPQAFVPPVPPDVFLGLTFTQHAGVENEASTEHEIEDKVSSEGNGSISHGKERQFISVADIDNELWEKIRSGTKTLHQEDSVEEAVDDVSEDEDDIDQRKVSSREISTEPALDEEGNSKTYDPLTVKMMDSIEPPVLPRHIRTPAASSVNAHSISKQRLSSHLEEMNERFEAIEKITQNMDREFHSSNVLLNAIDSIGEILSPPARPIKTPHKSSVPSKKVVGTSRGRRDDAPWRRETSLSSLKKEGNQTFMEKDTEADKSEQEFSETRVKESRVSFKETDEVEDEDIEEELSLDDNKTQETHDKRPDAAPTLEQEGLSLDLDESRDKTESGIQEIPQEDNLQDDSRHSNRESLQDLPMLSSDKLKQLLSDSYDSTQRSSQRSVEKRQKVQDWMAKKRKERHAEWKNEMEDLRSTEFKPFTTATEGPSSIKKIKLAEKERETKRRAREETHIDERMKEASNLINEMLSEPVPKANTLQNVRYAPPTTKQKKQNTRYGTKATRVPSKTKKPTVKTKTQKPHHRDPTTIHDETPLTSSPIYPINFDRHSEAGRYNIETRSVTPSGSDFVTTKTYRMHEKEKLRRSHEIEKEIQQRQEPQMDAYGFYNTDTSIDIDHIMDQIPDGSTLDEDRFDDINDLLSDDSELKELLSDVLGSKSKITSTHGRGRGTNKIGGSAPLLGTVTLSKKEHRKPFKPSTKTSTRNPRSTTATGARSTSKTSPTKPNKKQSVGMSKVPGNSQLPRDTMATDRTRATNEKKGKTSKDPLIPLDNFDDVSPWNTGDSLQMSDDVAQLLAEAKQAIGDDISESSGSIMSNIDWEVVDKIMNDVT